MYPSSLSQHNLYMDFIKKKCQVLIGKEKREKNECFL